MYVLYVQVRVHIYTYMYVCTYILIVISRTCINHNKHIIGISTCNLIMRLWPDILNAIYVNYILTLLLLLLYVADTSARMHVLAASYICCLQYIKPTKYMFMYLLYILITNSKSIW